MELYKSVTQQFLICASLEILKQSLTIITWQNKIIKKIQINYIQNKKNIFFKKYTKNDEIILLIWIFFIILFCSYLAL